MTVFNTRHLGTSSRVDYKETRRKEINVGAEAHETRKTESSGRHRASGESAHLGSRRIGASRRAQDPPGGSLMTFLSGARECRAAPQAPLGLAAHPDSSLCGVSAQLLQPPGGSRKPGNRFYPPVSISQASAPGPGGEPYTEAAQPGSMPAASSLGPRAWEN